MLMTALVVSQPVPAPVVNTLVEIKNDWSEEVTLILNDTKFKIPAKDTKAYKITPGEFTYQIEGVTDRIVRQIKEGEKFGIVVRANANNTANNTDIKPPVQKQIPQKEIPQKQISPQKSTGTLNITSKVPYDSTIIINGERHILLARKTLSIEVPAGKIRVGVLGSPGIATVDCSPGGIYPVDIVNVAANYQPFRKQ